MHDHVKPTVRDFNPEHILHCGTNNLSSERTASQIAKSIIELALSLKNKIPIFLIVPQNDNLNNKASEVNSYLVRLVLNETFLISTILIEFSQKKILMKLSYILTGMGQ